MGYSAIYISFLRRQLRPQKKIRIIFDSFNGATGPILKKIFAGSQVEASFLNARVDGNFPAHGPNPLQEGALAELQKAVQEQKADIGVAFDADGDRAFFVDDAGRILPAHLAAFLLFHNMKSPLVAEITTYEAFRYTGLAKKMRVICSRVGTYFIKKEMARCRAGGAAEYSGHYYFADFANNDSGILAAIKMANILTALPYRLSQFVDLLPNRYSSETFNFETTAGSELLPIIEKKYASKAKKINRIDGLTFEFAESWFNVRPSNTEPMLRVTWGKIKP